MCLFNVIFKETIEEVEAWKVFARRDEGLYSVFSTADCSLIYKIGEKISVTPSHHYFYAFKDEIEAIHIAEAGDKVWCLEPADEYVVRRVVLYDVHKGDFSVQRRIYVPAYIAKGIKVCA